MIARVPFRRRGILLLLLLCLAAVLWLGSSLGGQSADARAGAAALAYARGYMVWSQGPVERSVQILPLDHVRAHMPGGLRNDVNVAELEHRYGPHHRVALAVLSGTYNSLPPDEGVDISGEIVVLVDEPNNRVLLVMA